MSDLNNIDNESFRAQELCSRKLWELVSDEQQALRAADLRAAIEELADRRHYLEQLQALGKLELRN